MAANHCGDDFAKHLADSGLVISSGPIRFLVHTKIPAVIQNLARLYSGLACSIDESDTAFFDFHIAVRPPNLFRKLWHRQAQFFLDDQIIFNPFPIHHATAMLEWGMNWCVSTQINTYLIIHAAVIEKNGFAVVLPAPPGSGKSTLCASLVLEGWRLLSDELTLINLQSANAVPIPRPIGLKNQSIQVIRDRYPDAIMGLVSSDTLKGSVSHLKPPENSIQMQAVECPVAWIVFPKYQENAATQLVPKAKGQSFMAIADNAFNFSHLGSVSFDTLKQVVENAKCYDFCYSQLDEAIAVFNKLARPNEF